ncbi:uncharacterized protein LOC134250847 [Saccostrea cucullata]|uniref:uncharacterized protein LOC134250847 n=1 Tax=Saccostrea cuccullata TaxID=36930 RepID=UPI002ED095D0
MYVLQKGYSINRLISENYDCNEEVEVSSCSSTEDLPSLEGEGLPRSRIESSLDQSDTLPLTVEVTFTFKEGSFTETFANNTKVSTLKQYAASKLNTNDCIVMLLSGHTMSNDDRLMNLSSSPGIETQM